MFRFNSNTREVKDIYTMFKNGALINDSTFQRHSIWGQNDRIRLIETILLNLIIPELFFWKTSTDPESGSSITKIIDGQQRINTIINFIDGNFLLRKNDLIENESKIKWANKYFNQLTDDEKTAIWNYNFMIIEIDTSVSHNDIEKMFKRLNLTNYNEYNQEKRNSLQNELFVLARELSENKFWDKYNLFNASDVKLNRNIEFCATIILLYRDGLTNRTTLISLNNAYDDMHEKYFDVTNDKKMILNAIDLAEKLIDKETNKFFQGKVQLYTLFSILFFLLEHDIYFHSSIKDKYRKFIFLYEHIENITELSSELSDHEKCLFKLLNDYKLASIKTDHKHSNRMIRFIILKNFLFHLPKNEIEAQKTLLSKLIASKGFHSSLESEEDDF